MQALDVLCSPTHSVCKIISENQRDGPTYESGGPSATGIRYRARRVAGLAREQLVPGRYRLGMPARDRPSTPWTRDHNVGLVLKRQEHDADEWATRWILDHTPTDLRQEFRVFAIAIGSGWLGLVDAVR
jgi:hypothetical protein